MPFLQVIGSDNEYSFNYLAFLLFSLQHQSSFFSHSLRFTMMFVVKTKHFLACVGRIKLTYFYELPTSHYRHYFQFTFQLRLRPTVFDRTLTSIPDRENDGDPTANVMHRLIIFDLVNHFSQFSSRNGTKYGFAGLKYGFQWLKLCTSRYKSLV